MLRAHRIQENPSEEATIFLIVPKENVEEVKIALEQNNLLDKSAKISIYSKEIGADIEGLFIIPTKISINFGDVQGSTAAESRDALHTVLSTYPGLKDIKDAIHSLLTVQATPGSTKPNRNNVLINCIQSWLETLPPELLQSIQTSIDQLLQSAPHTYTIYPPMLLLPSSSFQTLEWRNLLSKLSKSEKDTLYSCITRKLNVTHIATNAPIPASSRTSSEANVLRSPVNLAPLHGDFGKPVVGLPTPGGFSNAFWVEARQNGITQTWAPLYTMFSRGNITEKARLLTLPSVTEAVRVGEETGKGSTAVDLYAGIGYFAFSYARAGVSKVLCWELNPWSVEGLIRGAKRNKWKIMVRSDQHKDLGKIEEEMRLLVFQESNEHAREKIEKMRDSVPPIRHVNCGLLPTSRGSWETAVWAVDEKEGGWVHLHENIATSEIEHVPNRMLKDVQQIYGSLSRSGKMAVLEHVERVKTYAPGVMHCVLDVYIPPKT